MARYIGYNTVNQIKKHVLTDSELVKRDLLNSLTIRQGDMPGRPTVGTNIWDYVFDPNDNETLRKIEYEIQRIISGDPRIIAEEINVSANAHTVLIELNVRILPNVQSEIINLLFDENSNTVSIAE